MNWIFKTGDYFQIDSDGQKALVTIEQKRNFTGEVGEYVLVLAKTKTDWEFTAHYRIANIEVKNPDTEYKQITITLALIQKIKEEKLLDDYVYSLRRITNYAYPIKHFSRKYSRLYDAEYEAIVEDKIYLKRTILGTVLNAMHSEHQKAFISYVAIEAPELLAGKTDIDKSLSLLLQYLDFAVVTPARYLRDSAELMKSLISEKEISEIGFTEDAENIKPRNTQMISQQVDAINEYLGDMFGFSNQKIGLQLLELEDNRKFKTLFRNAPLPITLK